jgi:hypothetical protein
MDNDNDNMCCRLCNDNISSLKLCHSDLAPVHPSSRPPCFGSLYNLLHDQPLSLKVARIQHEHPHSLS